MRVQVESWHPCPHIPGCIVVNVGDSLQAWSDGILKSNFHRVRMPAPGEPTVRPPYPPYTMSWAWHVSQRNAQ